ncbi:MAG: hypothetical protein JWP74_1913 [Marmoricola sp.]|nr:hypothetical protein [Marmoricola sp.]
MDTTTVALVAGGIGVVGTLAGVAFTQWRSDVRERHRSEVEQRREQNALLLDHRRTTYVAVIREYHRWKDAPDRPGPPLDPSDDLMADFWHLLAEVDLYGSRRAAKAASELYFALHDLLYGSGSEATSQDALDRFSEFLDAARTDFGIAPDETAPHPGEPSTTDGAD